VAKLYISVEKPALVSFNFQRIIASVSWRPHYDIHVNSTSGIVTMMYHALVHQESGHTWNNVSMELCTGAPSSDRSLPQLSPWFIHSSNAPEHREQLQRHHYSKMAKVATSQRSIKKMSLDAGARMYANSIQFNERGMPEALHDEEEDDDGSMEPDVPMGSATTAEVQASGVSEVFLLPKRQTIPASHHIRVHITSINLKANLTYTAVPQKSTKVYVQASITNDSPYTLLPGSSLVFVDGSFVGSSAVKLIPTNGQASLDVGIDNALSVTKRVVSDETKSTGSIITRTTTRDLQYELVVKSMRSFGVTVKVRDQVPLPQSEDLKVQLIKPNAGELRADHKQMRIESDTNATLQVGGQVVWERHLSPDSILKIPLHFSIEVNADRHIRNFEM